MIAFLYSLYNFTINVKVKAFYSLKLDKIFRLIIRALSTHIFYYVLEPIPIGNEKASNFVVNITSFPSRIKFVHITIISLMRQSVQPKEIILWLSKEQFSSEQVLPTKLLNLQAYGLVIKFVEGDLRSYKKYVHFIRLFGHEPFIIFDDDIIYPPWIIQSLVSAHKKHTKSIICNRCVKIANNTSYSKWKIVVSKEIIQDNSMLPTGCGGVLYPKDSLSDLSTDESLFLKLCPDGDDIWLYSTALHNGRDIVYTGGFTFFIDLLIPQNKTLCATNIKYGNDAKVRNVKRYFKESFNFDIFS